MAYSSAPDFAMPGPVRSSTFQKFYRNKIRQPHREDRKDSAQDHGTEEPVREEIQPQFESPGIRPRDRGFSHQGKPDIDRDEGQKRRQGRKGDLCSDP